MGYYTLSMSLFVELIFSAVSGIAMNFGVFIIFWGIPDNATVVDCIEFHLTS